jgi:hypothetical protein
MSIPAAEPAWIRDLGNPGIIRYWDGTKYVAERHWDGEKWTEPVPGPLQGSTYEWRPSQPFQSGQETAPSQTQLSSPQPRIASLLGRQGLTAETRNSAKRLVLVAVLTLGAPLALEVLLNFVNHGTKKPAVAVDGPPLALMAFILVMVIAYVIYSQIRTVRNKPLKSWVRRQPVTFSTKAHVMILARGMGDAEWTYLSNPFGGAQLVVRTQGIEVGIAGVMQNQYPPTFLDAKGTTMWIERVGLANRECIRLSGEDRNGKVDVAVSPRSQIERTWEALIRAGVTPVTEDSRSN